MAASISSQIIPFFFIIALFVMVDSLFIFSTRRLYENQIVTIQRVAMTIKPLGAIACYLLLAFGLLYFIILPSQGQSKMDAVYRAFWLGLVVYGVYASTVYAILKKWKPEIAIMDTIWGGILFASVTWLWLSMRKYVV
jgi:uncharacterized membrane protein